MIENTVVYTPNQLARYLAFAFEHRKPVLIKGAPGIGKTDIVFQAAENRNTPVLLTHPVIADPTDYKGLPFAIHSEDGTGEALFLPFGDLKRMIQATEPLIVFIDDLGQAPESVQKAIMQLLLARCIGEHKVSEHVTFVAATNRRIDKAGVTGILEPVKSRFISIVELVTELDDWVDWALRHNVSTEMIQFIRFRPHFLHEFKPSADLVNSPCPRTIVNCDENYKWGLDKDLEKVAYAGAAGLEFAGEFMGFLEIYRTLPNPDTILSNPDTADVPESLSVQMALVGALARKCTDQTIGRLVKYFYRLPAKLGILAIHDAEFHNPDIVNTREYIQWQVDHKDLLV